MTILKLFEWTTGSKEYPLFHVDGNVEESKIPFCFLAAKAGKGVAELLVDPVFHG